MTATSVHFADGWHDAQVRTIGRCIDCHAPQDLPGSSKDSPAASVGGGGADLAAPAPADVKWQQLRSLLETRVAMKESSAKALENGGPGWRSRAGLERKDAACLKTVLANMDQIEGRRG